MNDKEQLDAFATAAMQAILASPGAPAGGDASIATRAYVLAGSMMDARRAVHAEIDKSAGADGEG